MSFARRDSFGSDVCGFSLWALVLFSIGLGVDFSKEDFDIRLCLSSVSDSHAPSH